MDEERKRILKMLAEGTISVEECEELLQALSCKRERQDTDERQKIAADGRPVWPYVLLIVLCVMIFGGGIIHLSRSMFPGFNMSPLPGLYLFPLIGLFSLRTGILALPLFIFWIWMIVDCLGRPTHDFRLLFTQNREHEKWIWAAIVVLASWMGGIIYFVLIRQPARSIAPPSAQTPGAAKPPAPVIPYIPSPRARSLWWLWLVTVLGAVPFSIVASRLFLWQLRELGPGDPHIVRIGSGGPGVALSWVAALVFPLIFMSIVATVFWFAMLISCLVRDYRDFGTIIPSDPAAHKVVWLFIIFFTWVIGAIAYHISIRRRIKPPGLTTANHNPGCPVSIEQRSFLMSERKRLLAAVLAFFFGVFGAHRFYAGKTGTAVIQLFTIGGLGIWAFIDLLIILFGEFTDKEGRKIVAWT